jgi:ketosteroid isomerase-like protein
MPDRCTQPGEQCVEFVLGRQQLATKFGQLGYLLGEHRLDEIQPRGKMPVQRPAGDPRPPSDLVQGGVHAELGERNARLLEQLLVVASGVRAPGTLTEQDRIDINDLISLHGHLIDAGELDQAGELFTPDVTYDVDDFGLGSLHGTAALRAAALALGDANPVGHHVTNIVITRIDDRSARVQSKGIGIKADGTAGSVVYDDIVTRQPDGWKIHYRKVTARRAALGKHVAGPRAVLESWRQAAINQSAEDMRRLYAVDAVHEFPFVYSGMPSRLEGRDDIVNWIAAGWKTNPLKYERYRTLAIHGTNDPDTIIVEQEALGTSATTGEFALPNIIVLTVHNGQIAHLRDYANILAAAAAMGHDG